MVDFTHCFAILIGIDADSNGAPQLTTSVNHAARLVHTRDEVHP